MRHMPSTVPDYGIPQMRKRVFFVGLRDGKTKFEFPEPVVDKEHYVTCEEAIGDLPSLQTEKGEIIYGEEIQDYTMKPAKLSEENEKQFWKSSESYRKYSN